MPSVTASCFLGPIGESRGCAERALLRKVVRSGGCLPCHELQESYVQFPWLPGIVGNLRIFCAASDVLQYVPRSAKHESELSLKELPKAFAPEDVHVPATFRGSCPNGVCSGAASGRLHAPLQRHKARRHDGRQFAAHFRAHAVSFARLFGTDPEEEHHARGHASCAALLPSNEGLLRGGGPAAIPFAVGRALPGGGKDGRNDLQLQCRNAWERCRLTLCQAGAVERGSLGQGGNTCYLASLLQCWFHLPAFGQWLAQRECNCGGNVCLSCLLATTSAATVRSGSTFALTAWNSCISVVAAAAGEEQDVGEFMKKMTHYWEDTPGAMAKADAARFYARFAHTEILHIRKTPQCDCSGRGCSVTQAQSTERFISFGFDAEGPPLSVLSLLQVHLRTVSVDTESEEDRCNNLNQDVGMQVLLCLLSTRPKAKKIWKL